MPAVPSSQHVDSPLSSEIYNTLTKIEKSGHKITILPLWPAVDQGFKQTYCGTRPTAWMYQHSFEKWASSQQCVSARHDTHGRTFRVLQVLFSKLSLCFYLLIISVSTADTCCLYLAERAHDAQSTELGTLRSGKSANFLVLEYSCHIYFSCV